MDRGAERTIEGCYYGCSGSDTKTAFTFIKTGLQKHAIKQFSKLHNSILHMYIYIYIYIYKICPLLKLASLLNPMNKALEHQRWAIFQYGTMESSGGFVGGGQSYFMASGPLLG